MGGPHSRGARTLRPCEIRGPYGMASKRERLESVAGLQALVGGPRKRRSPPSHCLLLRRSRFLDHRPVLLAHDQEGEAGGGVQLVGIQGDEVKLAAEIREPAVLR